MVNEAISTHPLVFVLFYTSDRQQGPLLGNYSAAAKQLFDFRVHARLTRVEVRPGEDRQLIAKELGVTELPEIRIFRHGRMCYYQAGASQADVFDVARWNAGYSLMRLRPTPFIEIESAAQLEEVLNQHQFVVLSFTAMWCSRCLTHSVEFAAASVALLSLETHVFSSTVNVDVPSNRILLERFDVAVFPMAKFFYRGRSVGDLSGMSLAHELVSEVIGIRDDLIKAESAAEAGLRMHQRGEL